MLNKIKKITAAVMAVCLFVALFAGCAPQNKADVKIAALNGPTGMGFAGLFGKIEDGKTVDSYKVDLYGAPTDVNALVIGGKVDIAAVPANVAATLYKKTNGAIKIIAINTLSVMYILSKDGSVSSVEDLKGKTVYMAGQGATPEYSMRYILERNNITDCNISFLSEHAEVVTQAVAGNADVVLLPEPQVSVLLSKNKGFEISLDINEEWNKVSDAALSMGALIVSNDFAEKYPEALGRFLKLYKESVDYVNANVDEAAAIIAQKGIVPNEALAKSAIPNCNIVCITGADMKTKLSPFFEVLYNSNSASVGGALPDDAFYYTGN
ncbi:MAG: ABC transporter substrate-binding protein [Clostridia bacterium]|nr:ABC transporter substrate-binding protein [Clostridia bacterium]